MIYRLLGAVGLVLFVWLVGVAVEIRIETTRVRIERQSERISELGERCQVLRDQTRSLGAPEGMLPPTHASRGSIQRVR